MNNSIAIIIGAVIISVSVSGVQGQGSCKNPISVESLTDYGGNFLCSSELYHFVNFTTVKGNVEYKYRVLDFEKGTWKDIIIVSED